jgi:hypothetical protein
VTPPASEVDNRKIQIAKWKHAKVAKKKKANTKKVKETEKEGNEQAAADGRDRNRHGGALGKHLAVEDVTQAGLSKKGRILE